MVGRIVCDRHIDSEATEMNRQKQIRQAPGRYKLKGLTVAGLGLALGACSSPPMKPGDYHLVADASATLEATRPSQDAIPPIVQSPMMPPAPREGPELETYSVVVSNTDIRELLFAMARDARINVDVHPAVTGRVTINAIEQTLPQILNRLSRQIDLRYEFDGANLVVSPDEAFVRHYPVDYVNISREAMATTSIATQISSAGGSALEGAGGGQTNNNSTTQIVNASSNQFWKTLVANLEKLLGEGAVQAGTGSDAGPASAPGGAAASNAAPGGADGSAGQSGASQSPTGSRSSVFANAETGIVTVWASNARQERVQEYLDRVMRSARRQVLIEATIAEVQLSEAYQQGVNWQKLRLDGTGWSFQQQPNGTQSLSTGAAPLSGPGGINFPRTGGTLPGGAALDGAANASMGVLSYLKSTGTGNIGFALSLLQSFGKVKVLSSPKISVLNNQTAVLKVVDNRVYFTIDVQVTPGSDTTAPLVTYTSKPNTVPVGFVMSVTPQIKDTGTVTMNVRPTISRIIGFVNDPNPALAQNNVISRIPEIQTREIESILKVDSGNVAVMGGLMQESIDDQTDAVPGPGNIPLLGELFRYRNDNSRKSELVIFLRPVVITDASMEGDYSGLKSLVPGKDFFTKPTGMPVPRSWRGTATDEPTVDKPAADRVHTGGSESTRQALSTLDQANPDARQVSQ